MSTTAGAAGTWESELAPSIRAIPQELWRELAPADDPMWSWGLFDLMERGGVGVDGFEYHLFRRAGRVEAILPSFRFPGMPLQGAMEQPWQRYADALQRRLPSFLRIDAYFAGHPLGEGRLLAAAPAPGLGEAALRAVEGRARGLGYPWVIVKDLDPAVAAAHFREIQGPARAAFFPVASLPEAVLDLGSDGFDGYLAALSVKARRNLRRNQRRFAAHPALRIERRSDFLPLAPRLHALYEDTLRRARVKFDRLPATFFAAAAGEVPVERLLLAGWEGERLVGFLLCLFAGRGGVCLRAGIDAALSRESRLWFALHYAALEAALERGCRRLNFCQSSFPPKIEMGCALHPRVHLATHTRPAVRALIRRALPPLLARQNAALTGAAGGR